MTSPKRTPGSARLRSCPACRGLPRAASGLGSNESMCVTPPAIQSTMTDLAVALDVAVRGSAVEQRARKPQRTDAQQIPAR